MSLNEAISEQVEATRSMYDEVMALAPPTDDFELEDLE